MLALKTYLIKRSCDKTFSGGVGSFLLVYMILGYYQNYEYFFKEDHKLSKAAPDILKFIEFYSNFDE